MLPGTRRRCAPLFDIHPRTGTSIEVFFADRALETFGRCGALVGFGGLAVGASRQSVPPLARSLRATPRIGMR